MKKIVLILAAAMVSISMTAQNTNEFRRYECFFNLTTSFDIRYDESDYNVNFTNGYRFNGHLFLGGGIGVNLTENRYAGTYMLFFPVYATFKANITEHLTRVSPFVTLNAGGCFGGYMGMFVNPDIGVDINLGQNRRIALMIIAGAVFGTPDRIRIRFGIGIRF